MTCDARHMKCDRWHMTYKVQPIVWAEYSFKRDTRVSSFFVQKWCFSRLEKDFSKYFLQEFFFLVLTSRICFRFKHFLILHIHKKWIWPLLYHLFTKTVHILTLVEPNQMKLGFVITNKKASCVAKEDSICFFCIAKYMALNKQQPCVPFSFLKIFSHWITDWLTSSICD